MSLGFTTDELAAVTVLTSVGRSQETIARASGLSLKSFQRAMEKDEDLRESWLIGRAIRREQRIADLERESKKGNVRATELLLRFEHRDAGAVAGKGGDRTTININADSVAAQIDGRTFTSTLARHLKKQTAAIIEHEPQQANPEPLDPIAAVKAKQRENRND